MRRQLKLPSNAVVVGTAGNRVSMKRHHVFVRIAKQIAIQRKDVYFLVIGSQVESSENQYRQEVVALAESFGLVQCGRLAFIEPTSDMASYMKAMDIFVMTSLQEGTSLVTQEALASGLPVVAPAAGSLPDVVKNGITGLLVDGRDVDEMCGAVLRIIDDKALRSSLVQNARQLALTSFAPINCATVHNEAFKEAIRRRASSTSGVRV
jgi:L-malate glycosyltransferase